MGGTVEQIAAASKSILLSTTHPETKETCTKSNVFHTKRYPDHGAGVASVVEVTQVSSTTQEIAKRVPTIDNKYSFQGRKYH